MSFSGCKPVGVVIRTWPDRVLVHLTSPLPVEPYTVSLISNDNQFEAPEPVNNVSLKMLDENGPDWKPEWTKFTELEAELAAEVADNINNDHSTSKCYSGNPPATTPSILASKEKLHKLRQYRAFFERETFHPNSLLNAEYITGKGLVSSELLGILKKLIECAQEAKNRNIIKDDGLTWLRGRLCKLIMETVPSTLGSFMLDETLRMMCNDGAMNLISQQLRRILLLERNELLKGSMSRIRPWVAKYSKNEQGAIEMGSKLAAASVAGIQTSSSSQSARPEDPSSGAITLDKFGCLPRPIDRRNPPAHDFSVGPRRHDLPPRPEIKFISIDLPMVDRSKYPRFYATTMFSDVFLNALLGMADWAYDCVNPFVGPQTLLTMYPRAIWLLRVSHQLCLPHTIGAHGLIVQREKPVPNDVIVPLFIGEKDGRKSINCWWYAGQYAVDQGELLMPKSVQYEQCMRVWAQKWVTRERAKEQPNPEIVNLTGNAMYERMLSQNGNPPDSPFYIRHLIFKEFDQQFYQDLMATEKYVMS